MKQEVEFDFWMKCDLRVGEVLSSSNGKVEVSVGDKKFSKKKDLDVKKGDKIVVGLQGEGLIIPLVDGEVIVPEKDIDNGARIG